MLSRSEPVNAGPLNRLLTILASKTSRNNVCIKVKPGHNLADADAMRLVSEFTLLGALLVAELFEFYRHARQEVVATHGNLNSLNVLVRGDEVVGIVD